MRCVICKSGDVRPGSTTFTVERGPVTLVLDGLPARVCSQCGEAYFDEATTQRIEDYAANEHVRQTPCEDEGLNARAGLTLLVPTESEEARVLTVETRMDGESETYPTSRTHPIDAKTRKHG